MVEVVRPSRAVTRSRSCSAALRLKVRASTESGAAPRFSMRSTIASTRVVVLPVPGPGEDEQRATGVVDDALLVLVELGR